MPQCLVIGYGNPLRRDDGAGVKVAEAIADLNLPGVNVMTRHQLLPELAEPISKANAVIFVDADLTNRGQAELCPIVAASTNRILAHVTDPRSLLALSKEVFGGNPKAWSLAIPAEDLNFGYGFSPASQKGIRIAVALIQRLVTGWTNSA